MASADQWRASGGEELFTVSTNVRREYLKLPRDLETLTRNFGIALSHDEQTDTAALAFSIECVDRLLDAIPQASERSVFSDAVVNRLAGSAFDERNLTPELSLWLSRLEQVLCARQVRIPFCRIVRRLLDNSEIMRTTRSPAGFVDCACREGRLMVELLLLILGRTATTRFRNFMRRLSEPANLGDKLRDARHDYARGELAIRPGPFFYLRLTAELFKRTLTLATLCRGNSRLLAWGIKSLFSEIILFRFSKSHAH
jgi:hypothetical protein